MLTDLQAKKLTRYFQIYDINDDGRIESSDFERVIENVRVLRGASEHSPEGEIGPDELLEIGRQFYSSDDPGSAGNMLFGPFGV
jgi:hypothetical protein